MVGTVTVIDHGNGQHPQANKRRVVAGKQAVVRCFWLVINRATDFLLEHRQLLSGSGSLGQNA